MIYFHVWTSFAPYYVSSWLFPQPNTVLVYKVRKPAFLPFLYQCFAVVFKFRVTWLDSFCHVYMNVIVVDLAPFVTEYVTVGNFFISVKVFVLPNKIAVVYLIITFSAFIRQAPMVHYWTATIEISLLGYSLQFSFLISFLAFNNTEEVQRVNLISLFSFNFTYFSFANETYLHWLMKRFF